MINILSKIDPLKMRSKVQKLMMAFALMLTMGFTTLGTMLAPTTTVYAATGDLDSIETQLGVKDNGVGNDSILKSIVSLISMLARVVGVLLGVYGLYKLIVAFKDQDANGITQGVVLLAVGIILIMFENIAGAIFKLE